MHARMCFYVWCRIVHKCASVIRDSDYRWRRQEIQLEKQLSILKAMLGQSIIGLIFLIKLLHFLILQSRLGSWNRW